MSVASLPMYDFAEIEYATDALWAAIAARLVDRGIANVPPLLLRSRDLHSIWTDPDLLMAQTCGYPLVTSLKDKVALLATPRYTAPGCDGALYRSAIIVRASDPAIGLADLRHRPCAVNDPGSNSGMNLLRAEIAPLARGVAFFSDIVLTGSHAASIDAVASGQADVAAIDCITWSHLQHLRPSGTAGLRVLAWTRASPGLPLITAAATSRATHEAIVLVLNEIAAAPAMRSVRAALRLEGFEPVALGAYEALLMFAKEAVLF
jgi:ABC-type phosphate/phosphonate transport system substrate-binding protein